jgi:hypothetical protein
MSVIVRSLDCPDCPPESAVIEGVVWRHREATGEVVPLCPTHGWLRHPYSDGWLAPANCPGCGRGLIRSATVKSACCSEHCANVVRCRRKRAKRNPPREPQKCPWCPEMFVPRSAVQETCGRFRCRKRAQRAAHKDREAWQAEARQALEARQAEERLALEVAAQAACRKCGSWLVDDGRCANGHSLQRYLLAGGLDARAA